MVSVLEADILYHVPDHGVLAVIGHDADAEWQDVRCDSIVAIEDAIWIEHMVGTERGTSTDGEELLVEGLGHLLSDRFPEICLTSPLLQQLQHTDDVGR